MIIAQTPFRVSFFGGGTDLPSFLSMHSGAVLGTAIDKYIYHTVSKFPAELFDYSIRISYSNVEKVKNVAEITHAPFREILQYKKILNGVEIHIAADLPTFTGLGTSSSFTVGLISALNKYSNANSNPYDVAKEAIFIEQKILREHVGSQDQVLAAYGGMGYIEFDKYGDFKYHSLSISKNRIDELAASLMLIYTGKVRYSGLVEKSKADQIK